MKFIERAENWTSMRGSLPIALLPTGYPNEDGRGKTRKSLEEAVRYEHG